MDTVAPRCKLQAVCPVSLDSRRRQLPKPSGGWGARPTAGWQRLDSPSGAALGGHGDPVTRRGRQGPGLSPAEWAAGPHPHWTMWLVNKARCGHPCCPALIPCHPLAASLSCWLFVPTHWSGGQLETVKASRRPGTEQPRAKGLRADEGTL